MSRPMDRESSLRFFAWLTAQNLWEQRARPMTLACSATLALIVALPLGVATWLNTQEARQKHDLASNPLNLALWATYDHYQSVGITLEKASELDRDCRSNSPTVRAVRPVVRGREIEIFGDKEASRPRYQTVAPGDPILSVPWVEAALERPLDTESRGAIVTRSMLRDLGYSAPWPRKLTVEYQNHGRQVLPVLGTVDPGDTKPEAVAAPAFPADVELLVIEQSYLELSLVNTDPGERRVSLTVPVEWIPAYQAANTFCKEKGVALGGLEEEWNLQHTAEWRKRQWQDFVDQLTAAMPRSAKPPRLQYAVFSAPLPEHPERYQYVGIYVAELDELAKVARVCDRMGLRYDKDVLSKLADIAANHRQLFDSFLWIELAVALNGVLGLVLVHYLHYKQRMAEIGMLKAMGMRRGALRWLAAFEGVVLGVIGTALGFAAAAAAVFLLLVASDGLAAARSLVAPSPWSLVGVAGAVPLVSTFASLVGTREARLASPCQTLSRS